MAGQILIQRGAGTTGGGGGGSPGGANTQVQFNDGGSFGGDAGLVFDKTTDVLTIGGNASLVGEAANTLAQRNSTNAQTLRVYQTFTDASNYVRASLRCVSAEVILAGEGAGTGGVPEIRLTPSNTVSVASAAGVPLGIIAGRIFGSDGTNTPIRMSGHENQLDLGSTTKVQWGTSNAYNSTRDLSLTRDEPGVLVISDPNAAGAAIQSTERSTPGTPPANGWVLYGEDNGSGKTRLMVLFNTGAAQQVAIQP